MTELLDVAQLALLLLAAAALYQTIRAVWAAHNTRKAARQQ